MLHARHTPVDNRQCPELARTPLRLAATLTLSRNTLCQLCVVGLIFMAILLSPLTALPGSALAEMPPSQRSPHQNQDFQAGQEHYPQQKHFRQHEQGLEPHLFINEVLASNATGITDEDGDTEDWIELYYNGDQPLSLYGYGLSDDYDRPFRWLFPQITIHPGEFLLVMASGKDRTDPAGELHANFSISSTGEEIVLTAPDGTRIDELAPTEIPTDISLGRYPDGTGNWHYFTHPTPGGPNTDDGYTDLLEPVSFSHPGGFYSSGFDLILTHPDPDATIIYTLDGSEPDPDNLNGRTYSYMDRYLTTNRQLEDRTFYSHVYDPGLPITIDDRTGDPNYLSRMQSFLTSDPDPYFYPSHNIFKGTVIRAIAVAPGKISARPQTHSYFVTPEARSRYILPVISLTIQEDHLFGYDRGIYIPGILFDEENPTSNTWGAFNYRATGIDWERPASMELFEPQSGVADHRQDIGVRIHGGFTRSFPMKSLRLYARNTYGDSRFNYRMFPELHYTEFNRLMLRNSGNDWLHTMFRDAALQRIVGHMSFDTQAYRPFIVFINGEYWGIHNLRERYDKHYLARVYGLDPDNIDLLTFYTGIVKEGDNLFFTQTRDYIAAHGVEDDEHYQNITTRIDIENYIDYHLSQIYIANTDWPQGNLDFFRNRTLGYRPDAPYGHDGRLRWMMYDTDHGFGLGTNSTPSLNSIDFATATGGTSWPNPDGSTFLLRELLKNDTFRTAFITRYADQINTAFQPKRVHRIILDMAGHIAPEMSEHIARWNRPTGGLSNWQTLFNRMLAFGSARPDYARQHILSHFGISGTHQVTVDVSDAAAGFVRVNTIDITPDTPGVDTDPWPWTGIYFDNIPVTLTATAWPGYAFSHWEGDDFESDFPELVLSMHRAESVTAVFHPDEDPDLLPQPHPLANGPYLFDYWPEDAPYEEYPSHMAFVYMDEPDPGPDAGIAGFAGGVYNLNSRTRINGLGDDGFAFINTSNEDGNPGYPGTRLGGALLALNTQGMENIQVAWDAMTVLPNSRIYNLRLQYRLGTEGPFRDVMDDSGNPVYYPRNEMAGHQAQIGPVTLPSDADNKAYVQLLWRYYFTGEQEDPESGQRSKLAVSRIEVQALSEIGAAAESGSETPESIHLSQNYPNPFNPVTVISYRLPVESAVTLEVFDILGRKVAILVDGKMTTGQHQVFFDAHGLTGGVYMYRLRAGDVTLSRSMTLIK